MSELVVDTIGLAFYNFFQLKEKALRRWKIFTYRNEIQHIIFRKVGCQESYDRMSELCSILCKMNATKSQNKTVAPSDFWAWWYRIMSKIWKTQT